MATTLQVGFAVSSAINLFLSVSFAAVFFILRNKSEQAEARWNTFEKDELPKFKQELTQQIREELKTEIAEEYQHNFEQQFVDIQNQKIEQLKQDIELQRQQFQQQFDEFSQKLCTYGQTIHCLKHEAKSSKGRQTQLDQNLSHLRQHVNDIPRLLNKDEGLDKLKSKLKTLKENLKKLRDEYSIDMLKAPSAAAQIEDLKNRIEKIEKCLNISPSSLFDAPPDAKSAKQIQELRQQLCNIGKEISDIQSQQNSKIDQLDQQLQSQISEITSLKDSVERKLEDIQRQNSDGMDQLKQQLQEDFEQMLNDAREQQGEKINDLNKSSLEVLDKTEAYEKTMHCLKHEANVSKKLQKQQEDKLKEFEQRVALSGDVDEKINQVESTIRCLKHEIKQLKIGPQVSDSTPGVVSEQPNADTRLEQVLNDLQELQRSLDELKENQNMDKKDIDKRMQSLADACVALYNVCVECIKRSNPSRSDKKEWVEQLEESFNKKITGALPCDKAGFTLNEPK